MRKVDARLAAIEAKLNQLKARQQQLKVVQQRKDARARTVEARRSRREELRRKILVGAVVLAKVDQGLFDEKILKDWMNQALTRDDDLALFGLSLSLNSHEK